jgi:hypothetical protein
VLGPNITLAQVPARLRCSRCGILCSWDDDEGKRMRCGRSRSRVGWWFATGSVV